ncbi:MAG: hypothetical protein PHS45_01075 [Bacilli bacterium]|nr:hypothetical protein [Bacilli bacterium]
MSKYNGYVFKLYVFERTMVKNQFVFYRKDGQPINDCEEELARNIYIFHNISEYSKGKCKALNTDPIKCNKTSDGIFMRLTTNENIVPIEHNFSSKETPKGLIKSLFRPKAKASNDNNNK